MSELPFREQVWLVVLDKLVIAVILVAIGWYVNVHFEIFKNRAAAVEKETADEMARIQAQLNDLYYPLYFRLAEDDQVWTLMLNQEKYGVHVEHDTVLANNKKVLSLLEGHMSLLFRPNEQRDEALMKNILSYERHMAIYLALQASGDKRRPADLTHDFDYPNEICGVVEQHVRGLEDELSKLRGNSPSTTASPPTATTGCVPHVKR